jgi:hypothetical protein
MVRVASRLGISRRSRDVTPELDDYLASLPKDETCTNAVSEADGEQTNDGAEDGHATEDHSEPCTD